jgi:hypothetical protein
MHNTPSSPMPSDGRTVTIAYERLSEAATRLLAEEDLPELAKDCGWACAWLEACAYPGIAMLLEALDTTPKDQRDPVLEPNVLGLDLRNISCIFLAPRITRMVEQKGRLFLRNVRHGLYLVPFSVRADVGIGCPVDPSFAFGGERSKNPYEEKLDLARQAGISVPEALWTRMSQA